MTWGPRVLAVRFLGELFRSGRHIDELFQDLRFVHLDLRDRRLVTELVYGVSRNQALLDYYLGRLSRTPLQKLDEVILWILRVGLYQLEFLRIPERAVVDEAVKLCRQLGKSSASGFVNAVLRNFLRKKPSLPKGESPPELAARYSHPEWLVRRYCERYGRVGARALLERNNESPVTFAWVNSFKIKLKKFCEKLDEEKIDYEVYPDLPNCLIIRASGFSQHDYYGQGLCFLMDAASQEIASLPELRGLRVIGDFCAAPGGKAFLLASRKEPDAWLYCCDASARRLRDMRQRARSYQVSGLSFICADLTLAAPFRKRFDFVLLDVPCSGLGTLCSNPDIRWKIQQADLRRFHTKQLAILSNGFAALRQGGALLYSTCSTEPEENEQVIEEFVAAEPRASLESNFHRTFPRPHLGECFFAARIRHR